MCTMAADESDAEAQDEERSQVAEVHLGILSGSAL